MRKIVLIHLILGFFLFKHSYCQDATYLDVGKGIDINSYFGILPGFEIYTEDSANVTVATPIGLNFRFYNSFNLLTFFDLDFAFLPIVIDDNKFTSYFKVGVGYGKIGNMYNWELHLNYSHNFLGFSNLIGFGYDLETISIPLSIEVLKPFPLKSKTGFFLIGFKVPITNVYF